jgi:DNA-binding MarR family transcriptional regulator
MPASPDRTRPDPAPSVPPRNAAHVAPGTASSDAASLDRAETAARLAVAIGRINRRIRPTGGGLTQAQLSALSSIMRKGPLRPGDLARIESIAAPSATRIVADLEARGLIERAPDPADGRSSLVSPTEAGAGAVLSARAERAERISVLLTGLDDGELTTIVDALDALEIVAVHVPLPPGAEADRAD